MKNHIKFTHFEDVSGKKVNSIQIYLGLLTDNLKNEQTYTFVKKV